MAIRKKKTEDKFSVLDEVDEDIDGAIESSEKAGEVADTFCIKTPSVNPADHLLSLLLTYPHRPVKLLVFLARLVQFINVRNPLDTVAADEDGHDDQTDMGQPHLLLVNKHFL